MLKWHNILKILLDYFSLLRENIETFLKHFSSNPVWGVNARDAQFRNNSHIIHLIIVKNHVAEINARFRPQFVKVLFLPGKRLKNSYWLSYNLYDIKLRTISLSISIYLYLYLIDISFTLYLSYLFYLIDLIMFENGTHSHI